MEDNEEDTVRIIVVTSTNYQNSEPTENCVLEVSPCLTPDTLNGTRLVWDDMQRTLAFAWELHVYGSATVLTQGTFSDVIVGVSRGRNERSSTQSSQRPSCDFSK
uniref:Proline-rich transmembrane protein 3/4 domain-containing protein n=1 Tax=Knipowitschia caucasica TaxID=637954 RepID=A0AAV2M7I5_KNICA